MIDSQICRLSPTITPLDDQPCLCEARAALFDHRPLSQPLKVQPIAIGYPHVCFGTVAVWNTLTEEEKMGSLNGLVEIISQTCWYL